MSQESQELRARLTELQQYAQQQLGAQGVMECRLSAAILHRELVSPEQLKVMISTARAEGVSLQQVLESSGQLSPDHLLELQALSSGLPFIQLDINSIPQTALRLLPPETARMHHALPIRMTSEEDEGELVTVALANPASAPARSAIENFFAASDIKVEFVAAHPERIEQVLRSRYDLTEDEDFEVIAEEEGSDELADSENAGPARQYYSEIFQEAVARGASDVHLEVGPEGGMLVRFRIDGVMHVYDTVPEKYRRALMAVLKLDMDLDVSDERRLKNGRVTKRVNGREVDFRGANWVTTRGEEMVVRLLDREGARQDIAEMGFSPYNLEKIVEAYESSYGAIVCCGPTGSGKSSTLYAILSQLVAPERSILTIEDPVEYRMGGIQQQQVVAALGRDFSDALRNALRCDPDVIMVGEVRDEITAEISMRAAISGHLLLTTVHAMEASLAPISLIRMGVPAYQVADALRLIVSQRLVRRVCPECRIAYNPDITELLVLGYDPDSAKQLVDNADAYSFFQNNPEGCGSCNGGYSGRTAIAEVLTFDDTEKELLMSPDRSALNLRRLAISNGMVPLIYDGVNRAAVGDTTLAEVRRVVA